VLAAEGYPTEPSKGDLIEGLTDAEALSGVRVFHAGTTLDESGRVRTSGGRVLGVTARGKSLSEAHRRAYEAASKIHFRGSQMRTDIGHRALPTS
jgi:phosphoribosylamine--glycine ligase